MAHSNYESVILVYYDHYCWEYLNITEKMDSKFGFLFKGNRELLLIRYVPNQVELTSDGIATYQSPIFS